MGESKMAVKLDEIRAAAERVAASHGLDVVDIEFVGPGRQRTLRVYLEKNAEGRAQLKARLDQAQDQHGPQGLREGKLTVEQLSGVTHEDCVAFSRDFGVLLDVEDLVPGAAYTLEASSPGLDRKLTRPEDFDRFAGCLVKVQTFEPIHGNRYWQGRLVVRPEGAARIGKIAVDLAAKQNSKSRKAMTSSLGSKADVNRVEIALSNIEKADLIPEI
jgi:ribosome maturation factor RimP